ncbi:MAG: hypothetical protein NC041_04210 [Bacteroides sp.]|nr:hypothetical protein [Prevotella sp.]MCM1407909.1 hypothetical protein [Treponema brennaborense]MCM1469651.1 hypothetical protein [Bacteroides sp.]
MEPITMAALIAGASSLISTVGSHIYNSRQTKIQQEREDTATQRRASDLISAGLSPTLAAGSAADSSAPITGDNMPDPVAKALAYMQGKANISSTNAGTALAEQQATSEENRRIVFNAQAAKMMSEKQEIDLRNAWQDTEHMMQLGRYNSDMRIAGRKMSEMLANTNLLKAKTVQEQVGLDLLKTQIDNEKILRDMNNFNLTTAGIRLYNDSWNVNKGALGKIFGDLRQPFSGFDIRNAINNVDRSWYWDK